MTDPGWLDALARIFAGLGLFFAGVWLLTENLKALTGPRVRRAVLAWTRNRLIALGAGVLVGAVTQSTAAAIYVLGGMLSAGLLTVQAAIPVVMGATFGTSVLLFVASLDIELIMLFLVGLAGIAMSDDRFGGPRMRPVFGAVFGLSLLFFGLGQIGNGATMMLEEPWAERLLAETRRSLVIAFVMGAVLTVAAQSVVAICLLAITMASAGVFTAPETAMTIYGATFGNGLVTYLQLSKLRGRPRQLGAYQILTVNGFCSLVMVGLFIAEHHGGVPLVLHLADLVTAEIGQQMAVVFLLVATPSLCLLPVLGPVARLLERWFPSTQADADSRPQFIHDQALHDPTSAAELAILEQRRLIGFFTRYFEPLRDPARQTTASRKLDTLHQAFGVLSARILEFVEQVGASSSSTGLYERTNMLINVQRRLEGIEETLYELAGTVQRTAPDTPLGELSETIVEAIDTVVLTLQEAVNTGDEFDLELLERMTGDRGEVLQRIRQTYLSGESAMQPEEKLSLLQMTNLCERLLWLLGELQRGGAIKTIGKIYQR